MVEALGPGVLAAMTAPEGARTEADVWRDLGWVEWRDAEGAVWFCGDCSAEHDLEPNPGSTEASGPDRLRAGVPRVNGAPLPVSKFGAAAA